MGIQFFVLFILNWISYNGECATVSKSHSNVEQGLLVISYDAFRPEYLHRNVTPNLNKFRKDGTSAPFMLNVFPTKTFVNHHTMATGFYPEIHGVTGNKLYDSKLGPLGYSYDLFHYNDSIIPIWIANEKSGKHSGCMMWPGTDYPYNNVSCTFTGIFNESVSWYDRVDTAMSWFTNEKTPANLVMFYIEEPDFHAHIYGPESKVITDMVAQLDNLTKYIQDQLIAHKLDKRINVIHLSDHGMSSVSPPNFIDLREFVTKKSFKWYGSSPVLQIVPKDPDQTDEIYANLTKAAKANGNFHIYNSKNLPKRYHAYNERRSGPILAVANINYAFHDMIETAEDYVKKYNIPFTNQTKYGVHGYDNQESSMHAIFMAKGPIFNSGKILKSVNMIDLCNLFCTILNINCSPNSGSNRLDIWNDLFVKKPAASTSGHKKDSYIYIWIPMAFVLLILTSGIILLYRKQKRYRNNVTAKTNKVLQVETSSLGNEEFNSFVSDESDESHRPLISIANRSNFTI